MKKYVERLAFRSAKILDDWGAKIKKKISFVTRGSWELAISCGASETT
jgi:hypothetical protein